MKPPKYVVEYKKKIFVNLGIVLHRRDRQLMRTFGSRSEEETETGED
jgi:hypothetical protein